MSAEQFVKADEHNEVVRKLRAAKERNRELAREVQEIGQRAYENGKKDQYAELRRSGSISRTYAVRADEAKGEDESGIAYLTLPDNGGSIQFHVVGPMGATNPDGGDPRRPGPGSISLRVWGPPDGRGNYGVHEQGGGNLTDMSALFDLDERGLTLHNLDIRSRHA